MIPVRHHVERFFEVPLVQGLLGLLNDVDSKICSADYTYEQKDIRSHSQDQLLLNRSIQKPLHRLLPSAIGYCPACTCSCTKIRSSLVIFLTSRMISRSPVMPFR